MASVLGSILRWRVFKVQEMYESSLQRRCLDQCFKVHSVGNSPVFLQIKGRERSVLTCAGQISVQGMHVVFGQCGNPINVRGQVPDTKLGLGIILVWVFLFVFVVIVNNKIKVQIFLYISCSLSKREVFFVSVLEYVSGSFCVLAEGRCRALETFFWSHIPRLVTENYRWHCCDAQPLQEMRAAGLLLQKASLACQSHHEEEIKVSFHPAAKGKINKNPKQSGIPSWASMNWIVTWSRFS